MFRIQNNVPEVYVNDSRDFQLISRIYDMIFAGVKYNIDSLKHASNTQEINSQLLNLLRYKLGFFTNTDIDNEKLRHILHIFPAVIHKKGTLQGIKETLNLWFRVNNKPEAVKSIIKNKDLYCIEIDLDTDSFDTSLLDELFRYLLPTGYYLKYRFVSQVDLSPEVDYILNDELNAYKKLSEKNSILPTKPESILNDANLKSINAHIGFTSLYQPSSESSKETQSDEK